MAVAVRAGLTDAVPLFDISGGAGILPDAWPTAHTYRMSIGQEGYFGYAGGIGPENIAEQLPKIARAAWPFPYWIDMETRVRSEGDRVFDPLKVVQCLDASQEFMLRAP